MLSSLMKKENLFLRVAIGFMLGILFGFLLPTLAIDTKVVGDIYLTLIKMMIIPIVFCAVCGGIANISDISTLKRIGFKTVLLYVIMFIFSAIISLCVAYLIRPGLNVVFDNTPIYEGTITSPTVSSFLLNIFPSNIIQAAADGSTLPVIFFTILFSISIVSTKEAGKPVLDFVNSLSAVFFKMLSFIMELSPIGVMSLIAFSIAEYGAGIFTALGKYVLTCYLACIVTFILVMFIPTVIYTKISPKKLLKACTDVALVSLSTTSSAATMPTSINVCINDLKAPENITKFTLPLGCTINMCGGACSFCCLAVFVTDFYSLSLGLGNLIMLILVATLLNMAAPGIPGGGIILGASFLSIMGLPFDLMGPISAFYRLLDMAFTTINVEGDVIANLIISKSEKEWSGESV
ncbi:MAG: dicarboxylate/amino acid:cation symporter [bacterium]